MPNKKNAAGQPAGAGTPHVSASQIALLIEIAALAMQDFNTQLAVNEAKYLYLERLSKFEAKHGRIDGRLDPRNPEHAGIVAFTKSRYDDYQRSKKSAYNARRRLVNACRRAQRGSV
jgi:hypothetical protein